MGRVASGGVTCPVCLFVSPNVSVEAVRDARCWNCGKTLADHPFEISPAVAPGTAFAVNPDAIQREWFD